MPCRIPEGGGSDAPRSVDRVVEELNAPALQLGALRGAVLPVGGIREKVLAAHRAGVRRVLRPRHNEADLEDVPAELRAELSFVLLDRVEQVVPEALAGQRG